ncbi:MAG: hypothetical protein KJS83_04850 [Xanthomonadaceae bacterium]|nr:hypothetical protein [Xanthomonadaceae bacterium]MBU6478141.1 hypothetical protein [Xanthomonadaceae bacterium]MDE2224191.1 hypothetical protein [Xanthomonadaceae bacterium]MDE2497180.1 hypothetical protein [Xanthomonadaceae bacterium]
MNTRLYVSAAMALVGLSTVAVTHKADACGLALAKAANGQWTIAPPAKMSASVARMMFLAAGPHSTTKTIPNPLQSMEPIAGLYEITMSAEGNGPTGLPDGTPVEHAYVAWHADGGEIMNSGRPAAAADFCMGTWARTGARTYTLNHFALTWTQSLDANGVDIDNTLVGPASIQETVTLSKDGSSYTGTFVLIQYDTHYNIILPGGIPIKGTVAGTRMTIDSPVTY